MTRTRPAAPSTFRSRPGVALAIALAAIVVIGALIAGVFFASTQEYRVARNTLLETRSLTAAEYGLHAVMQSGTWDPNWSSNTTGQVVTKAYSPGDGSLDTVRITKLASGAFLVASEGRAGAVYGAQSIRRIGALVTLNVPTISLKGALTTAGQIKIGGSSYVSGNDTTLTGWNCPPAGSALPGITASDTSSMQTSGCNNFSCIQGSPKILQSSVAADTNTYFNFGGMTYTDLAAQAGTTVSGGTLTGLGPSFNGDGSCNSSDSKNWGEPAQLVTNNCNNYFPIIHSTGNLSISGGVGQGILLVDGDLSVQGGFEFYGPVIVRGALKTSGTGGHFMGGVMAADVDLQQNTIVGNAVIKYSSCVVAKAIAGSGKPVFATGRSWVTLY